eukprot:gene51778-70569_t
MPSRATVVPTTILPPRTWQMAGPGNSWTAICGNCLTVCGTATAPAVRFPGCPRPPPAPSTVATLETAMSTLDNIRIAKTFLEGIGGGRDPAEIAAPFADDLIYDFQGDTEALPWIGHRTGRTAVEHLIADL